jgi:mono/diheme cytochrome c family protein
MNWNRKTAGLLVALLLAPRITLGQEAAVAQAAANNQTAQERRVKRGATLFAATCTGYCHGANGTAGSSAPALAGRGLDGDYITKTVMYGIPGTAMVAWGQAIPKDDSAGVIEYVKSLNGIVSAGTVAPRPVLSAMAEHGRDLFFDSGGELTGCSNCHQINNSGIPVTPPLTNIPADAAGLRSLPTPKVINATLNGRTFPALVVSQTREQTRVYDVTTVPPVLLGGPPAAIKVGDTASWQHSSVLGAYSDADLSAILEFLHAVQRP